MTSFIGQNFGSSGGSSGSVEDGFGPFLVDGRFISPLVTQDDYTEDTNRSLVFNFEDEEFPAVNAIFGLLKPGRLNPYVLIVESTPVLLGGDLTATFELTGSQWRAVNDGSYLYSVTLEDVSGNRVTRLHSANHPNPYKHVTILKALTYVDS